MSFTLYNASAGSGKTYALTSALAQRIDAGLDPARIIATTFTKKAAAELSERVRSTLLDRGQIDAARGIDSALIGTVNSVAGRIVTEYALDAGISPDVQILEEEPQRAAFAAAIDRSAASAGRRWSGMLARTEHDGDGRSAGFTDRRQSWRDQVRAVADAARANLLSPEDLRDSADASWREWREAAELPERGEDLRARWLLDLGQRLDGFEADIRSSEGPDGEPIPGGEISRNSVPRARRDLETLRAQHRALGDHERASWSSWLRLGRGGEDGGKGTFGAPANAMLLPLATEIATEFPANPVWQQDVQDLISLIIGTAADSLDAYEAHKRSLGQIDFIDQEVRALRLLRDSPRVRESVRSRFGLLAVDEFQDTSPVQLALFLELSRLIPENIWVGDPKQAIYGFRGADPELMRSIVTALESGGTVFGSGEIQDLHHSWRSQQRLLDLSNALVTRVLARDGEDAERMTLSIPPERRRDAAGGTLEVWEARKARGGVLSMERHAAMIAEMIRERIDEGAFAPGDTAVLVRSHAQRLAVVSALQSRGVPTAGASHSLLSTREGQIVRAGLAVALDGSDTLALTELVTLLPDHGAHETWFSQLMAAPDRSAREAVFSTWWQDESLAGLRAVRREGIGFSPEEAIIAIIDALDLPQRIRRWSDQPSRRRTLDALRGFARETTTRRRAKGSPITLSGLRAELDAWADGPDLSDLPDAVWVGTIHAAKGLEWDHVVTYLTAPPKERSHHDGLLISSDGPPDVTSPLSGRMLRMWPRIALPGSVSEGLSGSDFATRRARTDLEEAGRLHYVALTRAARTAILAVPGPATILDTLIAGSDEDPVPSLLAWSDDEITVDGTTEPIPARVARVDTDQLLEGPPRRREPAADPLAASDIPLRPATASARRAGARFQASAVASSESLGDIGAPESIGPPLVEKGGPHWERVGEAIHAYLALPLADLTPAQRDAAARRLVERWVVGRTVEPQALLRAGAAWTAYLDAAHPGAERLTEQPITWWNEDDQVMEGWIDALLRRPDGTIVLVDHKSYPGKDPVEHVREHYLGQLSTYSRALDAAGLRPDRILIHLPVRGEVLEVTLHEHSR